MEYFWKKGNVPWPHHIHMLLPSMPLPSSMSKLLFNFYGVLSYFVAFRQLFIYVAATAFAAYFFGIFRLFFG